MFFFHTTIYKGNTTWKAAKKLGWKYIKVLFVDFPNEQAAIAYGIEDNKSSEFSTWDEVLLDKFFRIDKINIADTGFSEREVKRITGDIFQKKHDTNEIGPYKEEEDTFDICVTDVPPSDKERILSLVSQAIEGTEYVASAF